MIFFFTARLSTISKSSSGTDGGTDTMSLSRDASPAGTEFSSKSGLSAISWASLSSDRSGGFSGEGGRLSFISTSAESLSCWFSSSSSAGFWSLAVQSKPSSLTGAGSAWCELTTVWSAVWLCAGLCSSPFWNVRPFDSNSFQVIPPEPHGPFWDQPKLIWRPLSVYNLQHWPHGLLNCAGGIVQKYDSNRLWSRSVFWSSWRALSEPLTSYRKRLTTPPPSEA